MKKGREAEMYGKLNFLKAGILFADVVNTVSEKYAEEISSDPEYGYGFEEVFRANKIKVHGILNGADYSQWTPEGDHLIPVNYSIETLEEKEKNKEELCRQNKLTYDKNIPVIGMISRLTDQKGFDLIAEAVDELLHMNLQLVILGTGEPKYHELLQKLAKKHPGKLAVNLRFDNKLAHLIEAGADMFLLPSKYEPCGLSQIYSLKYGTVPIVRETGGLADTIQNFDPATGKGNGFVFKEYNAKAMVAAIRQAGEVFTRKDAWDTVRKNGMQQDFSWDNTAKKYMDLYYLALKK